MAGIMASGSDRSYSALAGRFLVLFSRYNGAIIETQMWKMSRGRPGHHRVGPALRPLLLFLHIVLSNCASAKPTRIAIVGGGGLVDRERDRLPGSFFGMAEELAKAADCA